MVSAYFEAFVSLLGEMAPYLLLGFFIAGILHVFVPRRIYTGYLAGSGPRSVVLAALFGIPLPLCSCGVIPTAMSMRRAGASRAATVSFLISTPQTGVDSIAATAALLGGPFAVLRPVAAFVTALAGGMLVGAFDREENAAGGAAAAEPMRPERSFAGKLLAALRYGFVDMIQDIGRWLTLGLLIAAAITAFLPDDCFVWLNDYPLADMLFVLLLSVPMYLCATGSIPIAAALMLKGLSPGAALVLLMAGPATNAAAMMVVGNVLGRRTLLLYLGAIVAGAVGFGLLTDYLLPASWFAQVQVSEAAACCRDAAPWWKTLSGAVLVSLLGIATWLKYRKTKNDRKMQKTFKVGGMMCNHCKHNVERALALVPGVASSNADPARGVVLVEGVASDEAIVAAIRQAGYECSGAE